MAKDLQFTFKRPCLELSGEIGSLSELIGYMQEESASLTMMFGDDMEMVVQRVAVSTGEPQPKQTEAPAAIAAPEKKKPGRPAKPVEAVAPDPIPVPAAAPLTPPPPLMPSPPISAEPGPNGVPAFLDRATASTLPLPILSPAAPPPVGVWGPKVVAVLDEHKKKATDDGVALSDWLALTGLTIKGASYDDACRAVLMISDDKIVATGILPQLGLAS